VKKQTKQPKSKQAKSRQAKSKQPLGKKNTPAMGKFPTEQKRIAELRAQAFAREGKNAMIARAILNELDRPLRRRESDRALGHRLGVDHRTIARWRERIQGKRRWRGVVSRRKLLGLCQTLSRMNIAVMSQKLVPEDIRKYVVPAYKALYKFQFGLRTLPEKSTPPPSVV
jgi:hypothetical protein